MPNFMLVPLAVVRSRTRAPSGQVADQIVEAAEEGRPFVLLAQAETEPPGAEIETWPGWGHDFPKALIPKVIERITAFCKGK